MPSIGLNAGMAFAQRALGVRLDPYGAFNFLVEIEGVLAGGFTEVSGLDITTTVERFREGGLNDREHVLPKWTTQSDLVLKKGQTDIDLLWNWYADVVAGTVQRKNGTIYLLDPQGIPAMWWDFIDAYPIKWTGPTLNAASNTVAFESLTIAHHGLNKPAGSQLIAGVRGVLSAASSLNVGGGFSF